MSARKFAITLWLSIILLVCFSALAIVIVLWLRSQSDRKSITPLFVRADALSALGLTDFPPPTESESMRIIQNAIAAGDEKTLDMYVRNTHEVDKAGIFEFFAATAERDGALVKHQWIGSSDTELLQIQSTYLVFDKDGRITNRVAMLVPNETGTWQLDFPAYARWCDPPIHLMDQPGGYPGGVVRVIVGRDHYYNGPFSDDREWACFGIASPDIDTIAFAYCPIGSPEHLALQDMLAGGARGVRATLEIERVENAEARQFKITRIVSHDWVTVDSPPEEKPE